MYLVACSSKDTKYGFPYFCMVVALVNRVVFLSFLVSRGKEIILALERNSSNVAAESVIFSSTLLVHSKGCKKISVIADDMGHTVPRFSSDAKSRFFYLLLSKLVASLKSHR